LRTVLKEDRNGYLRAWLIRDNDPDDLAEQGIPIHPPDFGEIDWDAVEKDIHNALVRRGLFTTKDLGNSQDKVLGIVSRTVRRHVVMRFKEEAKHVN
jgi:hypothetical protein